MYNFIYQCINKILNTHFIQTGDTVHRSMW